MTYRYCPRCATPLQSFDEHPYRRKCPNCGWIYWGNAKPTACALVEREGPRGKEVLLVRRAIEPCKGMWDIPGGFLDLHETPEQAVRRELQEETGLHILVLGILGIWPDQDPYGGEDQRTLNIVYAARVPFDAQARAGDDASAIGWFTADALPAPGEIAFESGVAALEAWLARQHEASTQPP
jgi:ADP-ribose pyrophosphatase YjhB (NUDIX family)